MAVRADVTNEVRRLAAELYETQQAHLLGVARRNCGDVEIGEEALQDSFLLFIDHFDPDSGSPPLAWLTLTLKRRCWAIYRHRRSLRSLEAIASGAGRNSGKRSSEELADPRRSPVELIEAREALRGRRARLATLKPTERRALGLAALGYSYREICELTGWSYTKVKRSIYEGRESLRSDVAIR